MGWAIKIYSESLFLGREDKHLIKLLVGAVVTFQSKMASFSNRKKMAQFLKRGDDFE